MSIWRGDFPILNEKVNGQPLAYLDTASSAQKPVIVLESMRDIMEHYYANVHRGLYHFSQVTTQSFENVRTKVAEFINAPSENEIVFVRNTTEAINLVAQSWGRTFLKPGDEIILSEMEHHANIVPWQLLRDQIGIVLKIIPVLDDGTLDLSAFEQLLSDNTRLLSLAHISNSIGTINPVQDIIRKAKAFNPDIKTLVDGSQSIVHTAIDVQAMGCDFFVFTGHKLYGPTGAGVLWAKSEILESMPPYQGGGDMIEMVSFERTTYKKPPARFEAGTPAIIQVIGLGAAVDYIRLVGFDSIAAHEQAMMEMALKEMQAIKGIRYYGPTDRRAPMISFTADWGHPSDISMILDKQGVAVRAGHHCCMPLMKRFGVDGTIRASMGLYTNENDIHQFVKALKKAREMLS